MALTREKVKSRKNGHSFVSIPHAILEHENYARLSPRSVKLLLDLYGQYRGKNNGDLCAALSIMRKRGWRSKDQLQKAKNELLETGWIIQTKQGGLGIGPNLYAVTFQAINECGGKLDIPATVTSPGNWKLILPPRIRGIVVHHTDQ